MIDNASEDGSADHLRAAGLEVVERKRNDGFAAGVNEGFGATSQPYVIVLNADTEPAPGALDALVEHLERDPGLGVAAPRLRFPNGADQPNGYRKFPGPWTLFVELCAPLGHALALVPRFDRYRASPHAGPVAHASGAVLCIRRSAFDDAGPFDERYFLYLEETEWQQRVRERGWRIERVPWAEVVHHVRGGDDASDVPSPHFVRSARRYLIQRGHSPRSTEVALAAGILCSRVGLRVIAGLVPPRREVSRRRAAAYDELWSAMRTR